MLTAADLAERYAKEFVAAPKDIDAIVGLLAPEITIWHNYDEGPTTSPAEEFARRLSANMEAMAARLQDYRVETRAPHAYDDGFVLQFAFSGTPASGTPGRIEGVLICSVADGRITGWDEYVDRQQGASLR